MTTLNSTERAVAFYAEDVLDLKRWFQVADTDYLTLLEVLNLETLFSTKFEHLRLLDVGCGTGRFPELVRTKLSATSPIIEFDFLDPSAYCLQMMRESLMPPYKACLALNIGVESLTQWGEDINFRYDIVWAIHSLYFFEEKKIPDVIQTLYGLLKPETGVGFIYIAARDSFYMKIFDAYNNVFPTKVTPYLTAEQFASVFDKESLSYCEKRLHFYHEINKKDSHLMEKYLHKCVLDESQPLETWRQQPALHDLIDSYQEGEFYRFPQTLVLFQFGDTKQKRYS